MCTLAHVFEAAGLATVTITSIRAVGERMRPPRVLHCEFPLGRPLGKTNDPEFQHDVLRRAFSLLERESGPVLEEHPEEIVGAEEPLSCTVPPRFDPDLAPAVDEARGLRKAYDRALGRRGVSEVGNAIDADGVPDALDVLQNIVNGTPWKEAGIPGGHTTALANDIRAYYEEAALELTDAPNPGGHQTEDWFFERTEAGKLILAVRKALAAQGAPQPVWFYMAPMHRS
ncbi:MAG: hypothetical protein OXH19_10225 [Chloroflexi bacterium]|nr:hypothetical protein [Chloroflexota bacterium]MCY3589480.1 hypothetical protein [Chloroflexota bacterium]MCY3685040.1 hypothetical protein [Chloroflexota bacterium]MDE2707694.1 hypothetical protein [Chloroflexota bacterium]MYD73505.1 hypothetical protein [Chloroflexota bacterium]